MLYEFVELLTLLNIKNHFTNLQFVKLSDLIKRHIKP